MRTPIITLLALLFTSLANAQNCNLTAHKSGSDTTHISYQSEERFFVATGPAKGKSTFSFSTGVSDYIYINLFVEADAKPKTYPKHSTFKLQLEDNSEILLSVGPDDIEPKFYAGLNATGSILILPLTIEEAEKVLKVKPKMLILGSTILDGGFYLQPEAKKYFINDLQCIVTKKKSM